MKVSYIVSNRTDSWRDEYTFFEDDHIGNLQVIARDLRNRMIQTEGLRVRRIRYA